MERRLENNHVPDAVAPTWQTGKDYSKLNSSNNKTVSNRTKVNTLTPVSVTLLNVKIILFTHLELNVIPNTQPE
jgi:hypothetical protein